MSHLRHHRPAKLRPRHFQFSIGRLLVLMTVCAVVFSLSDGPLLEPTIALCLIILLPVLLFADFSERHIAAGTQALSIGRYRLAVERFSRAIEADPEDPIRYCHRAVAHAWCEDTQASQDDYSRAITLDSRCQPAWSGRSIVAFRCGDFRRAIDDATVALCLNPDDFNTLAIRATAYLQIGHLDAAVGDLSAALDASPNNAQLRSARGTVHLFAGQYESALSDLQRAVRWGEEDAAVSAATAHFKAGDHRAALANIRAYCEEHPDDVDARLMRAWYLCTCPDDALRDGPRAVELAEESARPCSKIDWVGHGTLAAACAEVGRFEEAVEHAEEALEQGPPVWRRTLETRLATYRAGRPFRDHGEPIVDAQQRVPPRESDEADNTGDNEADRPPKEQTPPSTP